MNTRNIPSLNWLRVFEATARYGSFVEAGKHLHMSASAVSQQVKALESHLRTPLFTRGARSVTLSDAGISFYPTVQQMLNSVETAAQNLFRGGSKSIVNVQVSLIFATSWLTPRLKRFNDLHPDITINIAGGYRDADIERVGPELYINFGTVDRSWGVAEPLLEETVYPVMSKELLASIANYQQVFDHRIIDIPTHQVTWNAFLEKGTQIDNLDFVQVDSTEIALSMAAYGYGIALARAPVTDNLQKLYSLVPCPYIKPIKGLESYHLMYKSKKGLSEPASAFRRWLLSEVRCH